MSKQQVPGYVLITPAKDEGRFVSQLVESVITQTVQPTRWVIVSDGSTDSTESIVEDYARRVDFMRLVALPTGRTRSFGAKALAFRRGMEYLGDLDYAFIGNLDADITLLPDYYEKLLQEFKTNPRLGVGSGACWDKTPHGFHKVTISVNHAVGAVQLFRRDCYEAIEGYQPVSVGGMDSLAVLNARMLGWETRVFSELPVFHHKPIDSAGARSASRIAYRAGMTEYHIGTHPLFAVAKALRRWQDSPIILSVFIRLFAFSKLLFSSTQRDASAKLVSYVRKEQFARMLGRSAVSGRTRPIPWKR